MKKLPLLTIVLLLSGAILGQNLPFQIPTVQIGNVYENSPDSAKVILSVNSSSPVSVEKIIGFPFYGDTVVTAAKEKFWIKVNGTTEVWIKAAPTHNVKHKGVLLAVSDRSPYGSFVIPYEFQGKYSNAYYNNTENKTEAALRSELSSIISANYTQLSYNVARDNMYATLDNNGGDVECVYTGRRATFNTRSGANANSFNCEHTFPQSLFNQNLPMRSDIHHLFSTDVNANSQRGNFPFDVVTNPSWQQGGSKKGSGTFEPRDAQKGATARAMMYFVLRYQDYANFYAGQKSILRQWHTSFPPTTAEKTRNDGIYALQNNRNPFVDYPQFAERITSLVGSTGAAQSQKMYISTDSIILLGNSNVFADYVYTVNVINYGNAPIEIKNLAISTADVAILGTGNDTTLQPGEYLPIYLEYDPKVAVNNEFLTFQSDVSGQTNISIPINSKDFLGQPEVEELPKITITNQRILWSEYEPDFNWSIYDATGRKILSGQSSEMQSIDLVGFKTGSYIFVKQTKNQYSSQKFMVVSE